MQNVQRKEVVDESENEEEYFELEITPALEKYLLEVDEGKHLNSKTYDSTEEMFEDILGYDYLSEECICKMYREKKSLMKMKKNILN